MADSGLLGKIHVVTVWQVRFFGKDLTKKFEKRKTYEKAEKQLTII
jgi:hypothetical protein